ncbi:MAG: CrcB family protein [bacterium]|nr:CrcB family protein [bacterium]
MPERPPPIALWKLCLVVALGGALGALTRLGVEIALAASVASPLLAGSLSLGAVNALGAGGLGGLLGRLERRGGAPWLRPFLAIGFLGAFTTFSGFAAHLRVLHLEAGPLPTAVFFFASCFAAVLLFHAARGPAPAPEARA